MRLIYQQWNELKEVDNVKEKYLKMLQEKVQESNDLENLHKEIENSCQLAEQYISDSNLSNFSSNQLLQWLINASKRVGLNYFGFSNFFLLLIFWKKFINFFFLLFIFLFLFVFFIKKENESSEKEKTFSMYAGETLVIDVLISFFPHSFLFRSPSSHSCLALRFSSLSSSFLGVCGDF